MLKGVNRQVVEVSQPNSEYFERIFYIVKPEFSNLSKSKLLGEADKLNGAGFRPPAAKRRINYALIGLLLLLCTGASTIITIVLTR